MSHMLRAAVHQCDVACQLVIQPHQSMCLPAGGVGSTMIKAALVFPPSLQSQSSVPNCLTDELPVCCLRVTLKTAPEDRSMFMFFYI